MRQQRRLARAFALFLQAAAGLAFLGSLQGGSDTVLNGAPLGALMLGTALLFTHRQLRLAAPELSQAGERRGLPLLACAGLAFLYLIAPLNFAAEVTAICWALAGLATLIDRAFGIVVGQDRAREKRTLHNVLSGLLGKIADPAQRARRIVGIPTHIGPLDAKTRGDQLGKVTIIGARPGAGKTAFTTSILADAIERNDPTIHPMDPMLFFSLEMDDEELVARVMCAMAGIEYESMMYGPKPDAEMSRRLIWAADCINASPLEIDDETPRTVEQIAAEIYSWHRRVFSRRKTRGKVVIDYLTRIKRSPGIKNLQDHVMHCMAVLADVAKRTGLAIVVLSQLTRGHVKEGRMPEMDDLKGGGDIEENAFHVILLHPLGKAEDAAASRVWRGSVAALVEKNRSGP